jgi:hypothetical protein
MVLIRASVDASEHGFWSGFHVDFHMVNRTFTVLVEDASVLRKWKIPAGYDFQPQRCCASAPAPQHTLVNHVHSAENARDTASAFYLTLFLERVKTYSFFDTF